MVEVSALTKDVEVFRANTAEDVDEAVEMATVDTDVAAVATAKSQVHLQPLGPPGLPGELPGLN